MTTEYDLFLSRHNYAIIDRASLEDESDIDGLPVEPLVPRALRGDEEKMPWIVPLEPNAAHMEMLAYHLECVEMGRGPCLLSCLLAAPGVTPKLLSTHLTNRLVLHSRLFVLDFLRYYDPRVFPHLGRILRPEQLRALYGPVVQWTFRFQGEWISLPAPEVPGLVPRYWAVNPKQHEQLNRVILLNGVLDGRKKQLDRPWDDLDEYQAAAQIADEALETAQTRYGLSKADSLAFARHALEHGEHFHRHSCIQTLLRVARQSKEMPYVVSSGMLNARNWASIAAESF